MSFNTQTFRIAAQLKAATAPKVTNVISDVVPGTEFSVSLDAGTKKFLVKNRAENPMQIAYISGESGTNYFTVPGCASYSEDFVLIGSTTLYVQTTGTLDVIEVIQWS